LALITPFLYDWAIVVIGFVKPEWAKRLKLKKAEQEKKDEISEEVV
jgi:hypothetical protein